jgi:pyridoxamine 5'-phosphate oxidase
MSLADIRREYPGEPLDERHSDADPIRQFATWLDQARSTEKDPTAMALATVDGNQRPSVRIVLLKGCDERGFVFYTNYESRKARDIVANPGAALVFYWPGASRQVRVEGQIERVSDAESDAYFASRPFESQIAASISPQSDPVAHREVLDALFDGARERYASQPVPRPRFWGGYRLVPTEIEFWQGRPNRLHDRLRYRHQGTAWTRDRLAP